MKYGMHVYILKIELSVVTSLIFIYIHAAAQTQCFNTPTTLEVLEIIDGDGDKLGNLLDVSLPVTQRIAPFSGCNVTRIPACVSDKQRAVTVYKIYRCQLILIVLHVLLKLREQVLMN